MYSDEEVLAMYEMAEKHRKCPPLFMKNILGVELWDKQAQIANALSIHHKVAVKSGFAVGKTYLAAAVVLWFFQHFQPCQIVTTATSWSQVEEQLWRYINRMYDGAKTSLSGQMFKTSLADDLTKSVALGISTDKPHRMQGFHDQNFLLVMDEAEGIGVDIWNATKALLTGGNCYSLVLGNPIYSSGEFYKLFSNPYYKHFTISCYDCPNVIEGKEIIPGLVTKEWIEERKREWGENSPLFRSRVLAEFSEESENILCTVEALMKCRKVIVPEKAVPLFKIVSADIARSGDNKTVILVLEVYQHEAKEFYKARVWKTLPTNSTVEAAGAIQRCIMEEGAQTVVVDDVGVGGGVTDELKERKRLQEFRAKIVPFIGNSKAQDQVYFQSARDEAYWNTAQKIKEGVLFFEDNNLVSDFSDVRYSFPRNKVLIESKGEMKQRGKPSPDYGDALSMGIWAAAKDSIRVFNTEFIDFLRKKNQEIFRGGSKDRRIVIN